MLGLLGRKLGQTRVYDAAGRVMSVTVVLAGPNRVLQRKTKETDGYDAVQLGFGAQKLHRLTKAMIGHLAKHGAIPSKESRKSETPPAAAAGADASSQSGTAEAPTQTATPASSTPEKTPSGGADDQAPTQSAVVESGPSNVESKKRPLGLVRIREFRDFPLPVKPGDLLGPGSPGMFSAGDFVDAIGVTKGRGFEGVVKRHHFRGGDLTHGAKGWHRRPGAIGQRLFPGTVRRGLRMPGHMGQVKRTVQNLEVIQVLPEDHLLLVKGAIPGAKGDYVILREAKKRSKAFMQALRERRAKAEKEGKGKTGAKTGK